MPSSTTGQSLPFPGRKVARHRNETTPSPKERCLAGPGQLEVDLSPEGAGLATHPGALLTLHLVSSQVPPSPFRASTNTHTRPPGVSPSALAPPDPAEGCMAQTYPLPLPKQTEALKGMWDKNHLGDVSLSPFFSVVRGNFHSCLVNKGNPWSMWDGSRGCS